MTPVCPHRAGLYSYSGWSWSHSDGGRRAEPHAVSVARRGAAIHLLTLVSWRFECLCEAGRRNTVARGAPSNEAEIHPRDPGPSSEAEMRSRGLEPLSEAEIHSRGLEPSSEAEIRSRGLEPSSEAEM